MCLRKSMKTPNIQLAIRYAAIAISGIQPQRYPVYSHSGIWYPAIAVSGIQPQRYPVSSHSGIRYPAIAVSGIQPQWYPVSSHSGIRNPAKAVSGIQPWWYPVLLLLLLLLLSGFQDSRNFCRERYPAKSVPVSGDLLLNFKRHLYGYNIIIIYVVSFGKPRFRISAKKQPTFFVTIDIAPLIQVQRQRAKRHILGLSALALCIYCTVYSTCRVQVYWTLSYLHFTLPKDSNNPVYILQISQLSKSNYLTTGLGVDVPQLDNSSEINTVFLVSMFVPILDIKKTSINYILCTSGDANKNYFLSVAFKLIL